MTKKCRIFPTIMLMALIGCEPLALKTTQEEISGKDMGNLPSIHSVSKQEVILYPAAYDETDTISFKVRDADDVCSVDNPSVEVTFTETEDGTYIAAIRARESFNSATSLTIVARNGRGEDRCEISVLPATLSIDRDDFSSSAAGATLKIAVKSNVGLEVSIDSVCSSWVHVESLSDADVEVTIDRNTSFVPRTGTLTFSDSKGLLKKTFTVTQEAAIDYCKKEREALITLYNATGGRNWTPKSTGIGGKTVSTEYWCTDMPLDQWYGVELGGDGHVTYVHLGGMNLTGTLPEEIGDLVYCQELVVSDNSLTGELPSRIGDMQALKSFQAGGNTLSGDISLSTLSKIASKLKLVSLQGNEFTGGFPQWIGDMPEQCNFWLQDNCLSGVVPQNVQSHPRWNAPSMDGSGKTIGEVNMEQKSGYVLTLE